MPESPRRHAVVDIGSNAVRLQVGVLLAGAVHTEVFTRVPLALGGGVFQGRAQRVTAAQLRRLTAALTGMTQLVTSMKPCRLSVVATAALRAAANRPEVLAQLRQACGISVRVLSGHEEACLLGRYAAAHHPQAAAVLNADIGGGSTDCALVRGGEVVQHETFCLGTARADGGAAAEQARCVAWLRAQMPVCAVVCASGGSARVLQQCCGGLSARHLAAWKQRVRHLSAAQVAARYPITTDRAAQVHEALALYRLLLRGTAARVIHTVPGGLAEAVLMQALAR